MQKPDYVFEEVIDNVAEQYKKCVAKASELFTDEQAIQSASATMFINATKEKSTVISLVNELKSRIAKLTDVEAIPSAVDVWCWHFRDYINEFGPRLKGLIAYYVSINASCEQIEKGVIDRVYRLRCEHLSLKEQDELAKQMFGDDLNERT